MEDSVGNSFVGFNPFNSDDNKPVSSASDLSVVLDPHDKMGVDGLVLNSFNFENTTSSHHTLSRVIPFILDADSDVAPNKLILLDFDRILPNCELVNFVPNIIKSIVTGNFNSIFHECLKVSNT